MFSFFFFEMSQTFSHATEYVLGQLDFEVERPPFLNLACRTGIGKFLVFSARQRFVQF